MEDSDKTSPFDSPPPPGTWPRLELLDTPAYKVLGEFVRGASDDPHTRTVAVTSLVTTLWQLAGRRMSGRVPSLVLVDAGGRDPDPADMLAAHLFEVQPRGRPRVYDEGAFMYGTPEGAPLAMAGAVVEKRELGDITPHNASIHEDLENRYFAAQRTGFGYGPSRPYAEAWHDTFGLLTDRGGELVLRLGNTGDRNAFLRDVLGDGDRLRCPFGYGRGLQFVPKAAAVSGSIPAAMWDADTAAAVVGLGLPMLFLPSRINAVPDIGNVPVLEVFATLLSKAPGSPVEEAANFIPEPWFDTYARELRRRLHRLPGDYEYSIHKLARQVFPVCERIASFSAQVAAASPGALEALCLDLCRHTLRGLVLGVAGLSWHVLGFDPGCPRAEALRVLQYLRDKGPMTGVDLLRRAHLKKETRDVLVDRFEAEDLVRVEGKTVAATGYEEFVAALYARSDLPLPVDMRAALAGEGETSA